MDEQLAILFPLKHIFFRNDKIKLNNLGLLLRINLAKPNVARTSDKASWAFV